MSIQRISSGSRLAAIDQFRGFAIFLMVLADFLSDVEQAPAWLKHAPDIGYTIIDLIAPMFIFAIGLTFGISFRRRLARDGAWRAYEHFITRNLALIGLGALLTIGGNLTGIYQSTVPWGLLQAIGAAGLLTLPFIRLPAGWRWAVGLALLAFYQFMLDHFWLDQVSAAVHNGPWGALSWGALLIMATGLADLFFDEARGRRAYPWVALLVAAAGLALAFLIPVGKNRASASYILLSLGLSALVFYGFHLLNTRLNFRSQMLSDWGMNPLILYLLHGILIGVFLLPAVPGLYVEAPLWLAALETAAIIGVLSLVARYLRIRGWFFTP
jgi:predicted acyltransferase